jgi:predicted Zn-dependent protease
MQRRLSLCIAVLLTASCASRNPGDPIRPGWNVYSPEQDIQLGREAAAQILRQVEVVRDENLQQYIDNIGRRLAATPEAGKFPYEFTLINDPGINAFALPGGPIFINSGLIRAADNEAQAAGVIAHEIAHVALRHATSQASKANILQLPAAIAGAVIGQGSVGAQLGQIGLGLGLNALVLRYSRGAETEADALGARMMAGAGYNPLEMARFFEKLEAEGGSRAPEFLSSHPNPGNRVRNVQAEIQTLPRAEYTAGVGDFARMKELVARLPEPKRSVQRARLEAPAAAPSGGFRELQAGNFALAYPAGWEAFTDNQTGTVALGPRQGFVQDQMGRVSVGYGAILSYYRPQQARDPRSATAELLQVLRQNNPTMQVAANPRRVSVSGHQGLVTELVSQSPYGGTERDLVLTVARPEGLFYMVFIAPERAWSQLQPAVQQMVQSIRFRS